MKKIKSLRLKYKVKGEERSTSCAAIVPLCEYILQLIDSIPVVDFWVRIPNPQQQKDIHEICMMLADALEECGYEDEDGDTFFLRNTWNYMMGGGSNSAISAMTILEDLVTFIRSEAEEGNL